MIKLDGYSYCGAVLVAGGGGCWVFLGAILVAAEGAAGVANVRSFSKQAPTAPVRSCL